MRVLGLDVSTSVTGYTVLEGTADDFKIVEMGHIDFSKCKDYWEKADLLRTSIIDLVTNYHGLDEVYIEEALLGFRTGMSSAQTITTLMKFNGLASWFVHEWLQHGEKNPKFVAATHARKLCGIPVQQTKKCGKTAKEQVFEWAITGPLKDVEFEKTRTGKYKPFNYDRVDSYVIARAGLIEESLNTPTPSV